VQLTDHFNESFRCDLRFRSHFKPTIFLNHFDYPICSILNFIASIGSGTGNVHSRIGRLKFQALLIRRLDEPFFRVKKLPVLQELCVIFSVFIGLISIVIKFCWRQFYHILHAFHRIKPFDNQNLFLLLIGTYSL
jgi:hypothetical protein